VRVANETMARPIRNLTTMKGYDVTRHALACFGGAGGQHCCAIARSLGMSRIVIHKYSGILSAVGLSLADVVVERQEPAMGTISLSTAAAAAAAVEGGYARPDVGAVGVRIALQTHLHTRLQTLAADAAAELARQGFPASHCSSELFLNCRYHGTDTALMISVPAPPCATRASLQLDDYVCEFKRQVHCTTSFAPLSRPSHTPSHTPLRPSHIPTVQEGVRFRPSEQGSGCGRCARACHRYEPDGVAQ